MPNDIGISNPNGGNLTSRAEALSYQGLNIDSLARSTDLLWVQGKMRYGNREQDGI